LSYAVEWSREAQKQLRKLDPPVARMLVRFMNDRVHARVDPCWLGRQLVESSFWRYRVGDYRLLCRIDDQCLIVLVVEAGHRREVYR
jgi:mRNA interferase RelE/StbE